MSCINVQSGLAIHDENGGPAVLLATTAAMVGQLTLFLTAVLAPAMSRDFALTTSQLGVLAAAFFVAAAVCSSAGGRYADRYGGRVVLYVGVFMNAACLAGIAVAARSFDSLAIIIAISGVANGLIQPAANRYIARTGRAERQGWAFGVKQSAIPASAMAAGLAVPLIANHLGWRATYLLAVGFAVFVGAGLLSARGSDADAIGLVRYRMLRRERYEARVLGTALGLASASVAAMSTFMVVSLPSLYNVSPSFAAALAGAGSATGVAVRLFAGWQVDCHRPPRLAGLIAIMCVVGAIGQMLLAHATLLIPGTLLAYALGWGWPGLFTFLVVARYSSAPGSSTGITLIGGAIGSAAGPLLFGLAAARLGASWAWGFASVILACAGGLFLIVDVWFHGRLRLSRHGSDRACAHV